MRIGFAVITIVACIVMTLSTGGCGKGNTNSITQPVAQTGVTISDVAIAAEVDSSMKAVNPKTTFGRDVPEIHCSFKISNAPANTVITANWIQEQDADKQPVNKKIYTFDVIGEGNRYLDVYMVKPNQGWTLGDYKVVLSIGEVEKTSVQYSVKSGEAPYKPTYSVVATMASAVDAGSRPLDQKNTFTPAANRIYCVVRASDLQGNSEIRVRWSYLAGDLPSLVGKVLLEDSEIVGGGTHYIAFYATKPATGWPRGDYVVKIYVNGTEKSYVPFIVR